MLSQLRLRGGDFSEAASEKQTKRENNIYVCRYVRQLYSLACAYMHAYAGMFVSMYTCMHACMHAGLDVCMHACMYARICVYVLLYMSVYMCMYTDAGTIARGVRNLFWSYPI